MDKIKVLKFGGSSVENVDAIHRCARIAHKAFQKGGKLVVVVSAMGKQTDELLKLAFSVSDTPPERELDMLVSTGERVSCSLFAMALNTLGVKALSLTGSQCGILTNKVHQHADIIDIKGDRLLKSLESHDAVVVAGFQGVDPKSKEITTLGRGGSDLTAVALASKLGASACFLYKDVNGVMTTDPRFVPRARVVSKISWEKAYRLSCLGAKVLHYRASSLAMKKRIPLYVINTRDPGGLFTVVGKEDSSHFFLSYKESQTYLELVSESQKDLEELFQKSCHFLWSSDEIPLYVEKLEGIYLLSVKDELAEKLLKFLASENLFKRISVQIKGKSLLSIALLYSQIEKKLFYEDRVKQYIKSKNSFFKQFKEGEILFSLKNADKVKVLRELSSILDT